ncbi:uncharacterized protein LOC124847220 [Vigna umbellata]|uniref:uncharacterized protein LOC124847220 n=1 Tax=Vigna umbellata TaxID=87088 RepID=UPI001F5E6F11|nr:uncharacterized protein LOC124847220 [Vigna umbellata]
MVERAKVLEKNVAEVEQQKKPQQAVRGPVSSRSNLNMRRTPYARPALPSNASGSQTHSVVAVGRSGQQGTVTCFQCGGPHYRSSCPQLVGRKFCTRCRRNGHLESKCNMGGRAAMGPPNAGRVQQGRGGRAQTTGRVYAITGTKATSSGNLIIGTCLLYGKSYCVWYDSGTTHSFISKACFEKLGLTESEMQFDLVVSTPTTDEVRTSTVCVRCPIKVEGHRFKVNLLCLPLQGLEVILGMDWLTANHILIDCGEKRLVFPHGEEEYSITLGQIRQDIMEGASCFLVLSYLEAAEDERSGRSVQGKRKDDRSVIREFMDMFPDEVPELPPPRELEFSIDLLSVAGPVSITHTKCRQQS